MRSDFLWKSATLLTAANFMAALGNYIFQAVMGHSLPLAEFGYLNSALGVVALMAVPLAAASQAVAHYLAQHHANEDQEKLASLHAASRWWLVQLTWIFALVSLVILHPLTLFFHFPRATVLWVVLAAIPANLGGVLGSACCAGLSRFRLLANLLMGSAIIRLLIGMSGAPFFPVAELGLGATCLASTVLMGGLLTPPTAGPRVRARLTWNPDFVRYLTASLAICLGNFLFLQSDQIIAQRYLRGDWLGLYSAAGLLGRAVVWGSLPVLTVYFTQRSAHGRSTREAKLLLAGYLGLLVVGAIVLVSSEEILTQLILGREKSQSILLLEQMTYLINRFAWAMVPIGVLQAVGFFYLATRRLPECYVFGSLGILYGTALILYGQRIEMMLSLMLGGAILSLLVLSAFSLVRWSRAQP